MRTSNPALSEKVFERFGDQAHADNVMTIQGSINKTIVLFGLLVLTASFTWDLVASSVNPSEAMPWMIGGLIGGLIAAIATCIKPTWAPISGPLYAILEGLFVGGLSAIYEQQFQGIVVQAVGITFGTMFVMLMAYKTGMIKATPRFVAGVMAATGAICLVYLATWILGMFGVGIPYIHGNGIVGIGFSAFVVILAAMNLVLDFALIEWGAKQRAPKYMEWYAAFGLMVTLVWLYIEILRLLAKLQSRR